ncbi:ATP-binding protein [Streptomyces prasinus]|uniref:ATP-binding protein n=1 Tax=Streptomyces prasinus TaxID=67345 RepID=A0ABX6AYJ8_9ACTN|nr:ATP-binding protein [Streptomyces prasinus]QEV07123.1 ATP-binding protein [Streptomyces prasinus]
MPTVTPPWSYALQLPHDPRAPRIARVTLRAVLGEHGLGELVPAAELVAAELLANAQLHTTGPYALRLRAVEPGRLRLGVWDTDPRVPPGLTEAVPPGAPPDDSENGRGLPLVRAYASAWGAGVVGGGKVVWAECGG